jgi:hypothetical protein
MAITKIQSESLNLADDFAFTGTITGAGGNNKPAFEAYLSSNQASIADGVNTKINFNTKLFDTDNCYDNTTNYRFTPTTAGKYYIYGSALCWGGQLTQINAQAMIYKNGSSAISIQSFNHYNVSPNAPGSGLSLICHGILDMNGTSDYVEFYVASNNTTGTVTAYYNQLSAKDCYFGAYKIIT